MHSHVAGYGARNYVCWMYRKSPQLKIGGWQGKTLSHADPLSQMQQDPLAQMQNQFTV